MGRSLLTSKEQGYKKEDNASHMSHTRFINGLWQARQASIGTKRKTQSIPPLRSTAVLKLPILANRSAQTRKRC